MGTRFASLGKKDQNVGEQVHEVAEIDRTPPGILNKFSGTRKILERFEEKSPFMATAASTEARAEVAEAKRLLDSGEYKAAERRFDKLKKKYKNTTVEEDAAFYYAEALFAQKKYPKAQDAYDALFERFPATRHVNDASGHLYEIALEWLGRPELVQTSEIAQVNFEKPADTPRPQAKSGSAHPTYFGFIPNFFDWEKPIIDTEGRALQALRSVWLNDPTGPLADDALVQSADHHFRRGDYTEADRLYKILRNEYAQSPYIEEAFVKGSHVKLMSYQGPAYDGTSLEEARKLKESAVRLFPDLTEKERLLTEIRKSEAQLAARQWEQIRFYQRKGRPKAVAVSCHALLNDYPNSAYAAQAREIYNTLPADAKRFLPALPNEPQPQQRVPSLQPVPDRIPVPDNNDAIPYGPTTSEPPGRVKF
ncbi:tetratricopeptide repeat protein [Calycomorphotria hydatis]|nr:outer membrane protein assembly factor BamD [Calycomorphotria hydatis]